MNDSRKPGEPALVNAMFSRRLAEPVARLCVRLGIPANAVTVAGGLCRIVSLALPPLAMGIAGGAETPDGALVPLAWLWLAAAALWCLGCFLDVVDGSVARLTGTGSSAGFFLDYVFHVLFKPAFLFSVGLGLGPVWVFLALPGPVGLLVFLVLLFSIPANGSQASHAAELALRAECAAGRLRPGDGPAALWRDREISSDYLQAPLFALAVALDAIPLLVRGRPLVPFGPMPCTLLLWFALGALLAVRIPLRYAREWKRLALAGGPAPSAPAPSRRPTALQRAYRRFFLRLSFEPLLVFVFWMACMVVAMPMDDLHGCGFSLPAWYDWLLVALLPLVAILCAPAEEIAAAHVFCKTAAKDGSPDPAGAPWRGPILFAAVGAPFLCLFAIPLDWILGTPPGALAITTVASCVAWPFGVHAVLLSQLILLPWRLARVYRRLRAPAPAP